MENSIVLIEVPEIVINSKETLAQASDIRSQVKSYLKKLTEEKEKVTKPLNDALKAERARFKPFEEKAEAILEQLDAKMIAYQTAEAKRAAEEEAKIAARVGEGKGKLKLETAMTKMADIDTPDKVVGNTRFVTDYELVITDIKAIPDQYLKIEVKTAALKTVLKSGVKIPGCSLREIQRPVNI